LYFYILTEQMENEIMDNNSIYIIFKKNRIFKNKLNHEWKICTLNTIKHCEVEFKIHYFVCGYPVHYVGVPAVLIGKKNHLPIGLSWHLCHK